MSDPAAILATFAGFNKPVIGRRVVPLVFEVPIEKFQEALKALGTPDAANPVWCGIARTNLEPEPGSHRAQPVGEGDGATREDVLAVNSRSPSSPKPNSTRAVMMAKDLEFQRWAGVTTEADADAYIKRLCFVTSKRELNDHPGSERFREIRRDFHAWKESVPG